MAFLPQSDKVATVLLRAPMDCCGVLVGPMEGFESLPALLLLLLSLRPLSCGDALASPLPTSPSELGKLVASLDVAGVSGDDEGGGWDVEGGGGGRGGEGSGSGDSAVVGGAAESARSDEVGETDGVSAGGGGLGAGANVGSACGEGGGAALGGVLAAGGTAAVGGVSEGDAVPAEGGSGD